MAATKRKPVLCYSRLYALVASTKNGKVSNIVNMTHLLKTLAFDAPRLSTAYITLHCVIRAQEYAASTYKLPSTVTSHMPTICITVRYFFHQRYFWKRGPKAVNR
jgi:hypothetical protein